MNNCVKKVTIVGGGTAGWLTAGVIAAEHHANSADGIEVTLVESPNVATIGVGEGTWPTMRDTLRKIGLSEFEFLRECDASFKQGSKFVNWIQGTGQDSYYHPFVLPQGYFDTNLIPFWQSHQSHLPFATAFSTQAALCDQGLAPKQQATPEYAAVANYGYHLDAGKFANLLQRHCTEKLGVRHILDHVSAIKSAVNGDIEAVVTESHGEVPGDLFIDCSGLSGLLIDKHYQIPFESKQHYLFNDTALAVQIPYQQENDPIASATISTAQKAGWVWDIGLPSRRGVGYVYSSAHCSDNDAEQTLRDYIRPSVGASRAEQAMLRKININPGHRQKFWHKNCVAVGMASGFIEPLEASALALVELSATMISEEMPANREVMDITARRFNQTFHYRWQRIIEFLKLHYVLSQRDDSPYWIDNRNADSIPERLQELLQLWQYQPPSRYDFNQADEIFPSASYQYVLYGMGFTTSQRATTKRSDDMRVAYNSFNENAKLTAKCLAGLPTNRELLDYIRSTV